MGIKPRRRPKSAPCLTVYELLILDEDGRPCTEVLEELEPDEMLSLVFPMSTLYPNGCTQRLVVSLATWQQEGRAAA